MARIRPLALLALLLAVGPLRAGLYCSLEPVAELPSQWRGYLLDQRALRSLSVPARPGVPASLLRLEYEDRAAAVERLPAAGADELADLGAVLCRLGRAERAVEVLRAAAAKHPNHFQLAANLGTAWQLAGDLRQSAEALAAAVRLAPPEARRAEELHLRLVRGRSAEAGRGPIVAPDDLFGIDWLGDPKVKPPADGGALAQRLALWLPADGRLVWQLAELARAAGDLRTAAALYDGCVGEFGLSAPALRQRRQETRKAADGQAANGHDAHKPDWPAKSARPLARSPDLSALPPVRTDGTNPLPWPVIHQTTLDRRHRPTFHQRLRDLGGRRVEMTGFMQPVADGLELTGFLLIEFPVGCWFCESPEPTAVVFVELPRGKSMVLRRGAVKVTGTLGLNADDPEDFFYSVRDAAVGELD